MVSPLRSARRPWLRRRKKGPLRLNTVRFGVGSPSALISSNVNTAFLGYVRQDQGTNCKIKDHNRYVFEYSGGITKRMESCH